MSLPFFFPVLLMVNGGFTTLYSMFSRCSAFLFFRFKKQLVCVCRQGQLCVRLGYVASRQMSHLANLVPNSAVCIFMYNCISSQFYFRFLCVMFFLRYLCIAQCAAFPLCMPCYAYVERCRAVGNLIVIEYDFWASGLRKTSRDAPP